MKTQIPGKKQDSVVTQSSHALYDNKFQHHSSTLVEAQSKNEKGNFHTHEFNLSNLSKNSQFSKGALRGKPMSETVQHEMEDAFNTDFSDVRIEESKELEFTGSIAFTSGNHICYQPGKYNPTSSTGKNILGHELMHVVQQRQGRVQPTKEIHGIAINDDLSLEAEADRWSTTKEQCSKAIYRESRRSQTESPLQFKNFGKSNNPALGYIKNTGKKKAGVLIRNDQDSSKLKPNEVEFNPVGSHGYGTGMMATIVDYNYLPDGSPPSKKPAWWPDSKSSKKLASYYTKYMVQGHLLNHNLGGPGNDLRNLAPIHKRTNSEHEKVVEKVAKKLAINQGKGCIYSVVVRPPAPKSLLKRMPNHPTGKGKGNGSWELQQLPESIVFVLQDENGKKLVDAEVENRE